MTSPLLTVTNLSKHFPVYSKGFFKRQVGTVKAVDQVNFHLDINETLGLVGESGCGKTTMAQTILHASRPTDGKVFFNHNGTGVPVDLTGLNEAELKPLRQHMQMIFQDPFSSLNPRMTVGRIIAEPMLIHKLARGSELDDRVEMILRKVGLKPEHKSRYPHAFSGGQRQRIGIARALIMEPALVVADEAVSALDVSVQAQVINLLNDLQQEFGLAYLFIAHDLSVVRHLCDRVAVMYAGRIVEMSSTRELFNNPLHPYTQLLLTSVPSPDPNVRMKLEGFSEVADSGNLPTGCAFEPRCGQCSERCRSSTPEMFEVEAGHFVACQNQV
ncbi:MAG: ATP-binding cassette domain-containing protein [Candidatus Electrothrix sp. AR5]|nr:ATP-binding cassette domain-containing protein [Candidatus Electrothrix sp. AR5]